MDGAVGGRKRKIPWLLINVAACAIWLAVPGIRQSKRTDSCMNNLQKVSVAVLLYSWDFDGRLPAAPTWANQVKSYTSGPIEFQCPNLVEPKPDQFGHAYSDAISGKLEPKVANESSIPMIFDSWDLAWGAHGGPDIFANDGRSTIAFLDGSARSASVADFRR
jgi:hypothetical protein